MTSTRLGHSGVEISRVVFGCMEFLPRGGATDVAERVRVIHAAFDAGVTAFDTAPLYGFGASEELLARAIADRRGRVQVLTKVGLRWDGEHGEPLFQTEDGRSVRRDSRPRSLREQVEASLRRLGVETIELLQVHQRDHQTPLAETCGALAALQREGKVRAIGVSNFSARDVSAAAAALRQAGSALDALQVEYNLVDRRAEAEVIPAARAAGASVLTYSPLAQGLLAGRQLGGAPPPDDWRRDFFYFRPPNVALVNAALEGVSLPLARARGATPAQVALAWLLGQSIVAAVVAGARSPAQATANAAAALIELNPDEKRALARAFTGADLESHDHATGVLARLLRRPRAFLSRHLAPGRR